MIEQDEELPPRLLMQYIAEGLLSEWPYDVEIHCLEWLQENAECSDD